MVNTFSLPKFLFAVDTETSGVCYGPDPSDGYQIVSLGALVLDSETFEVVDTLYLEIEHDPRYAWSDGAEKIHGLSRAHLAKHGEYIEDAAAMLLMFVAKWFGTESRLVAVGHRVAFDIAFINRLLSTVDCQLQWDRLVIDSSSLGAALLGISGSDALFDALGLPERDKHDSLEDIVFTVEAIRRMQGYFGRGVLHG